MTNEYIEVIDSCVEFDTLQKGTLSKTSKSHSIKKVSFRKIEKKGFYSACWDDDNQTITKTYSSADFLIFLKDQFDSHYFELNLFTDSEHFSILKSKKQKIKILRKQVQINASISHDRKKKYIVSEDRLYLYKLGVSSKSGNVLGANRKKYKQINKYIEIIDGLLSTIDSESIDIVDMGCGKGYLTFALYDHIVNTLNKKCNITGIELRQGLVDDCNKLSTELGFPNLKFINQDIKDYSGKIDMIIALHACDIATDYAIGKGILSDAQVIVTAPCCHKQIRKQMKCESEIAPILKHGILAERQAEMVTDGLRALYMERANFKTKVFEFISSEHTGKNVMIIGEKRSKQIDTTQIDTSINEIKASYNITRHELEEILNA